MREKRGIYCLFRRLFPLLLGGVGKIGKNDAICTKCVEKAFFACMADFAVNDMYNVKYSCQNNA